MSVTDTLLIQPPARGATRSTPVPREKPSPVVRLAIVWVALAALSRCACGMERDRTPACSAVCDESFCGVVPCGVHRFLGTVFGDALCSAQLDNQCTCTLFECDPCGDGQVAPSEECDYGSICVGGVDAGERCSVSSCNDGYCETQGGSGCAANCTVETRITTAFQPILLRLQGSPEPQAVVLSGDVTLAIGQAKSPPPPPCKPAAIKAFDPSPVLVPGVGCVCVQGVPNAPKYGVDNVGVGLLDCSEAQGVLRAYLTVRWWVLANGCDSGTADAGPDGKPCTGDDPSFQHATTQEALFACVGDCAQDGAVTIDDLVRGVNIALGSAPLDQCPYIDSDGDGVATINEVLVAVNNALDGCQGLTLGENTSRVSR